MNDLSVAGHTFHIPVMGTGFTIDTPLKVARYGISSVVSLVDDVLLEQMRKYHSEENRMSYTEIPGYAEDARARRITAYLNLLNQLVERQVEALRNSPFGPDGEISRYFELLPEMPLKDKYRKMLVETDADVKASLEQELREHVVSGSIDVNIMTKLDRDIYRNGEKLPPEFADAMSALRGFANSDLCSSIIFSAGMNSRLFSYLPKFKDFLPDDQGKLKKKIVLKVSDYRSAFIQGKILAKKGIWVSEYRIESGLNCGGHAFATKGFLMGPILEEFKTKRHELVEQLHQIYLKAIGERGDLLADPLPVRVSVQGGIGTAGEKNFLMEYYDVDGTGWGTPFLLVPEVTNVDDVHLKKLAMAGDEDVHLSDSSPLGIPFWNLKTSASELERLQRIREGKPGSACPKNYLVSNTEFTRTPICPASRAFQQRKLDQLENEGPENDPQKLNDLCGQVMVKSCICHDLAGGVALKKELDPKATPAVCCGPNIVNFSKIASLEEMVGHIYGRLSLLTNHDRPHMFIKELKIYVDHLRKESDKFSKGLMESTPKYFAEFKENLLNGISYYRGLAERAIEEQQQRFLAELQNLRDEIERITPALAFEVCVDQGSLAK